ncbi:MAG: phospholipid carrier-dependent glycosyltransferase [bacterium]
MTNYLFLFCFLLFYAAFGRKILGFLAIKNLPAEEKPLFSIALGLGAVSLLFFALGCLGLIYGWLICSLFAAICFFSAKEFIPAGHDLASAVSFLFRFFRKRSVLLILLLLLLSGFIIINLLSALVPITEYDSLSYHLFAPKKYIAHHAIFPMPDSLQSYWPLAVEITYIPFLLLGRPELASLLSFAMGIFIVSLIIVFINKYISQNPLVSALAALLFYCQPVVNLLSTTPKIDLAFTLFSLLTLFSLFNWYYQNNNRWLWLASIFLGLTASIKLTGIFFFPIFFVGVFFALLNKKNNWPSAFSSACAYSSLALLFFLPWLVKTCFWTGDPIYPFLTSFNGHRFSHMDVLAVTLRQYLRLFWDITFNYDKVTWGFLGNLAPYFLALFPMIFMIKVRPARNIIVLLLLALTIITIVFLTGFSLRFIIPAIVLLSIVLASSYFDFLGKIGYKQKIFIIALLLLAFGTDLVASRQMFMADKSSVVFGFEKKIDYLAEQPPLSLAFFANRSLPLNAKIFSPHNAAGYYYNSEFVSGYLEFSRYYEDFEKINNPTAAIEKLKRLGVTHLAINTYFVDGWWHKNLLFKFYSGKFGGRETFNNPFYQPGIKDFLDRNYECVYFDPYTFDRRQFYSQNAINRLIAAINKDNYGVSRVENLEQLNALLVRPDWFTIWSRKKNNNNLSLGIIVKKPLWDKIRNNQQLLTKFFKNPTDELLIIKSDKLDELIKLACGEKDNLLPARSLVDTLQPILLLKDLAKKTNLYPSNNLLAYQQREITRLNRLTMELTYPKLCPGNGNIVRSDHFFLYKL